MRISFIWQIYSTANASPKRNKVNYSILPQELAIVKIVLSSNVYEKMIHHLKIYSYKLRVAL